MQTTSITTAEMHPSAFRRAARGVGKWFARAINVIGQPHTTTETGRWCDWPRFPPY